MLKRFFYEEDGQGMVEYGLIIALIAVVVMGVLVTLGTDLKGKFQAIVTELQKSPPS